MDLWTNRSMRSRKPIIGVQKKKKKNKTFLLPTTRKRTKEMLEKHNFCRYKKIVVRDSRVYVIRCS